jgi:Phage Mu protein F like protein
MYAQRLRASVGLNAQALASEFLAHGGDPGQWLAHRGVTFLPPGRATLILKGLYIESGAMGVCVGQSLLSAPTVKAPAVQVHPIDWHGWKPGDLQAADKVMWGAGGVQTGLNDLLAKANITIKHVNASRMKDLATKLGIALTRGDSVGTLAKDIQGLVDSGPWADMIATTEMNRATSAATLDTYTEAGLELKSWSTALDEAVCDTCLDNESQEPISIDDDFPSGDPYPPAHPYCGCVLLPAWKSDLSGADSGMSAVDDGGSPLESLGVDLSTLPPPSPPPEYVPPAPPVVPQPILPTPSAPVMPTAGVLQDVIAPGSRYADAARKMAEDFGKPNWQITPQTALVRKKEYANGNRYVTKALNALYKYSKDQIFRLEDVPEAMRMLEECKISTQGAPLYRGISPTDDVYKLYKELRPGDAVSINKRGFGSFSTDEQEARSFARSSNSIMFEYLDGAYGMPLRPISRYPGEDEWLVQDGGFTVDRTYMKDSVLRIVIRRARP